MWNRRSACLGVAVVFAWIAASWPAIACGQATDAFVGTWSLTVTPDDATKGDGGKAFQEAIVFEDAQLMAENYAYYGFNPGAYTIPEDDATRFSATMTSHRQGTLAWTGQLSSGKLSGQLVWTRQNGAVWRYTFTGSKQ